jgi:hypothetical protein
VAAETDPRLVRLAESVSDRAPVPWDEVRSSAGDLAPVVDGLRRLEALADAFASSQGEAGPGEPVAPVERWGQLEVLAPLGEGAFGQVFRARDPILDRQVALKLRQAGPEAADSAGRRLLDEARTLAKIRHPNVVAVHGADLYDGRVGIWTELVEGRTLEEHLAEDGPLGPGETVAVGLDLCRALAAIHAAGMVHGDVKAANVIRERGGRIVLADLGSATEAGASQVTGSPATLAPEVLAGRPATAAADLYSLGLLLARLLTGRDAAAGAKLRDLRPDLPGALVRVLERAADPVPERRYPSAGAFETALAGAASEPDGSPAGREGRSRRRAVWWAAAVAAAATIAVGLWLTRPAPLLDPAVTGRPAAEAEAEVGTGAEHGVRVAAEPKPAAGTTAGADAVPSAFEVEATMLRAKDNGAEPLAEGDRVRPGDRLVLEVEATDPMHVWVVNEDLRGNVFQLFPITGLDLVNPLPAGRRHRLPGRLSGVPQHWQVTSAGGRERFLVIASRRPLAELDRRLADLAAASAAGGGVNRGVGALEPAPLVGSGRLDALVEWLVAEQRADGSLWVKRLELDNP